MGIEIKPSDLYYKYRKNKAERDVPKFSGKPDPRAFDRDDLYELLPMFEAVMDHFDCQDAKVLRRMEEILIHEMPRFIETREEVFDALVAMVGDWLEE